MEDSHSSRWGNEGRESDAHLQAKSSYYIWVGLRTFGFLNHKDLKTRKQRAFQFASFQRRWIKVLIVTTRFPQTNVANYLSFNLLSPYENGARFQRMPFHFMHSLCLARHRLLLDFIRSLSRAARSLAVFLAIAVRLRAFMDSKRVLFIFMTAISSVAGLAFLARPLTQRMASSSV